MASKGNSDGQFLFDEMKKYPMRLEAIMLMTRKINKYLSFVAEQQLPKVSTNASSLYNSISSKNNNNDKGNNTKPHKHRYQPYKHG